MSPPKSFPGAQHPPRMFAYITCGGDWWATEERNFLPGMLDVPEEGRVPFVPEASLAAAVAEARAKALGEAEYEFVKRVLGAAEVHTDNGRTLEVSLSVAFIECMEPVVNAKEERWKAAQARDAE